MFVSLPNYRVSRIIYAHSRSSGVNKSVDLDRAIERARSRREFRRDHYPSWWFPSNCHSRAYQLTKVIPRSKVQKRQPIRNCEDRGGITGDEIVAFLVRHTALRFSTLLHPSSSSSWSSRANRRFNAVPVLITERDNNRKISRISPSCRRARSL